MRPHIKRLGTIDCDLVETTPIVFRDRLYRFEYVRTGYAGNTTGNSYFRFIDHDSGIPSKPFAVGYHLGNVMVFDGTLIVTGTNIWDGERIDIFASDDMEQWDIWNALELPGYGLFNTSMCRTGDEFTLMFEVGKPPKIAGVRFTARFAVSSDLRNWQLAPPGCNYSKDRYTAPHCLRYLDGYYYNFYLEALPGSYEQYVVRSRDLINGGMPFAAVDATCGVCVVCDRARLLSSHGILLAQSQRRSGATDRTTYRDSAMCDG